IEAASFGKSIEDYRLFWMEDPTPAENHECFRLIRHHTVTPIAEGVVFNSIWAVSYNHLTQTMLWSGLRSRVLLSLIN
ncbi:hypothetical protein SE13_22690, partial [Salmonella enterica subsp. enterica serovar Thompson]